MSTLNQIILKAVASSKRALRNHEIQAIVQRKRPGTAGSTVDTAISLAAKSNKLVKIPVFDEGRAKFAYAPGVGVKTATRGISAMIRTVLTANMADSYEIWAKVTHLDSSVTKRQVDFALAQLARTNKIAKSKNPMTDSNVSSTQSKYFYSVLAVA
jgi:glycyl-tRNA synthetase beta subunit